MPLVVLERLQRLLEQLDATRRIPEPPRKKPVTLAVDDHLVELFVDVRHLHGGNLDQVTVLQLEEVHEVHLAGRHLEHPVHVVFRLGLVVLLEVVHHHPHFVLKVGIQSSGHLKRRHARQAVP